MTKNQSIAFRLIRKIRTQMKENQNSDWKEVLVDIILKILTLGLYHVEKHTKKND